MSDQEFKDKVFESLRKDFNVKLTEEEIAEECPEYMEIIAEGKRSIYGEEYGIQYAANNIAMII